MARIVIAGYMVRHPVGGNLWAYFHYLLGLHRLGHEVAYVEESGWTESCYDPGTRTLGSDPGVGLQAVAELFERFGVRAPVLYVDRDTGAVHGGRRDQVDSVVGQADLLINVGGVCWLPQFRQAPHRALVDMDPLFTQLGRFATDSLHLHDSHFSYGVNIGRDDCIVPTLGIQWQPTVPPVVPDVWTTDEAADKVPESGQLRFTTVANWNAYGGVTHRGESYGQKDEEFVRFLDLPTRVSSTLEVALSGADDAVTSAFRAAGWRTEDGNAISADATTYESYVKDSAGEFSVAKNGYVKSRSGWFSDRSVSYLAAGRPVVLQDTGFSDWLPTGLGVLGFSRPDEAVACVRDVEARYSEHRAAARDVARRYFHYEKVLPRILAGSIGA